MPSLSRYRNESGVALVEMALVMPLLLLLVIGMVDFARAMNYWVDGTHLANVTARYVTVNKPVPASVRASTPDRQDGNFDPSATPSDPDRAGKVRICVSYPAGTSNVGDPVTVTTSTTYQWLGILVDPGSVGLDTTTTIHGEATMRLEARPTNFPVGCN
jgi:Flp pilus assembly protein TadG